LGARHRGLGACHRGHLRGGEITSRGTATQPAGPPAPGALNSAALLNSPFTCAIYQSKMRATGESEGFELPAPEGRQEYLDGGVQQLTARVRITRAQPPQRGPKEPAALELCRLPRQPGGDTGDTGDRHGNPLSRLVFFVSTPLVTDGAGWRQRPAMDCGVFLGACHWRAIGAGCCAKGSLAPPPTGRAATAAGRRFQSSPVSSRIEDLMR
jgi:hypothetical protein